MLQNKNKYLLISEDYLAAIFFFVSFLFPLSDLLLICFSPACKVSPSNTLRDWYDLERYWNGGRWGKASKFKFGSFCSVVGAWAYAMHHVTHPNLLMNITVYPMGLLFFTLFESFPYSTALFARDPCTEKEIGESEEEFQQRVRKKIALENFELDRINVNFRQMFFTPTSVLLAIGEVTATHTLFTDEEIQTKSSQVQISGEMVLLTRSEKW
jgi:hypothetical protein